MRFGVLVAAAAGLLWGYVYATKDNLLQSVHPLGMLAAFYIAGTVVLAPVAFYFRHDMVQIATTNTHEFVTAVAAILLAEFCIMWSIALLGGTDAGLIEVCYPLWTALFAYLVYNKTPSTGTLVGGLLIMAGIAVIAVTKPSEKAVPAEPEELNEARSEK
jgi:drug/metabolite transporter (DMT)-like permease